MPDPDEAQQPEESPRQRSSQPSARQMAERIAAQLDGLGEAVARLDLLVYDHIKQYEDDHIRETVRTHANTITALGDELHGFQNGITRQLDKMRESLAGVGPVMQGATDTMAGTNLEHIQDLQAGLDRTATKVSEVLARLEATERRLGEAEELAVWVKNAWPAADVSVLAQRVAELENRPAARVPDSDDMLKSADQILTRLGAVERRLSIVDPTRVTGDQPVGGVHRKVLELMRQVPVIGKDRQADQGTGGRFKFRGIDEAMDAVGHAMRTVGLTLKTEVLGKDYAHNPVTNTYKDRDKGEVQRTVLWTTATVTYRYKFVDPEDGSEHVFEMAGEGRDASDKATSKAGSMALKYGLLQALMVPVSGLDDSDTESPQVAQDRPAPGSGQQQRQPSPPADQSPKKAERSRNERAHDAVTAIRNINRWPADQRLDKLVAISSAVEREGLASIEVDGATVRAHIVATERSLAPPEPPADDQPPF